LEMGYASTGIIAERLFRFLKESGHPSFCSHRVRIRE
jgi:hypothetical protein